MRFIRLGSSGGQAIGGVSAFGVPPGPQFERVVFPFFSLSFRSLNCKFLYHSFSTLADQGLTYTRQTASTEAPGPARCVVTSHRQALETFANGFIHGWVDDTSRCPHTSAPPRLLLDAAHVALLSADTLGKNRPARTLRRPSLGRYLVATLIMAAQATSPPNLPT